MVFSSLSFLIFFLPSVLLVYFITPKRFRSLRNGILLVFSLIFYACAGAKFLLLMLASITINYACGIFCAEEKTKKTALIIGILLNLSLLAYFKYAGFFGEILHTLIATIPVPEIVLPIGISFFTFQGMSYMIDVYRGDATVQKNPLKVALYISFFPQLIAGPIVRYTTIAQEITNRNEKLSDIVSGTIRFLIGLGKKMVLANTMAEIADAAFAYSAPAASFAWLGIIAYALQIYFDFSAYSDMAIGLGQIFGFHFLENFNYPYIAKSVKDFWSRWHISLTTWFRDYLYIPLGGNRCSQAMHIRNIAIVWLLTGFWHGAAWNFVLWGLWYCCFLLGEKFLWGDFLEKWPSPVRHLYTLFIILLGWVLFRAANLTLATDYIMAMFGANGLFSHGQSVYYFLEYRYEWILCLIAVFPVNGKMQSFLVQRQDKITARIAIEVGPMCIALLCLAISYMELVNGSFNPFIYFRF